MFEIKEISKNEAVCLLMANHYRKTIPVLNKAFLGGFINGELKGVMTLGWGTRPRETIKKLWSELDTKDYYEIGRMALDNTMPKNSESQFIGDCIRHIRKNYSNVKVLFTWADGMLGKPGLIYQATNFYYAGFIWTDLYFNSNGEAIHPRATNRIGGRTAMNCSEYSHWQGKQFKYVYFIDRKVGKVLLKSCKVALSKVYPCSKDIFWKVHEGNKYVRSDKAPAYNSSAIGFSKNAIKCNNIYQQSKLGA